MRKNPHPGGSPGKTKGTGVKSGLSSHSQINESLDSLGKGQGQGARPKPPSGRKVSDNGKTFTIK